MGNRDAVRCVRHAFIYPSVRMEGGREAEGREEGRKGEKIKARWVRVNRRGERRDNENM